MEAVLAMMVVICGVMLVTTSLSFVGIDLRRGSGALCCRTDAARSPTSCSRSGSPFFEGRSCRTPPWCMLNTSLFHSQRSDGYCIALQDIPAGKRFHDACSGPEKSLRRTTPGRSPCRCCCR